MSYRRSLSLLLSPRAGFCRCINCPPFLAPASHQGLEIRGVALRHDAKSLMSSEWSVRSFKWPKCTTRSRWLWFSFLVDKKRVTNKCKRLRLSFWWSLGIGLKGEGRWPSRVMARLCFLVSEKCLLHTFWKSMIASESMTITVQYCPQLWSKE